MIQQLLPAINLIYYELLYFIGYRLANKKLRDLLPWLFAWHMRLLHSAAPEISPRQHLEHELLTVPSSYLLYYLVTYYTI